MWATSGRNPLLKFLARSCATVTIALLGSTLTGMPAAHAASWTDNCTQLHKRFTHGVSKRGAHDHTTGTPVTNFQRSDRLYRIAMNRNSDLDRDRDRIACEAA
jgi:hypothetical protein